MKNFKFILKHAAILCAVAFICTLLLVLCNDLTKDKIAKLQLKTEQEAQSSVLTSAESFENLEKYVKELDNSTVTAALKGIGKGGKTVGYCIKVEPSGYGGKISMMVGLDTELKVSGIKITSMSETPGLGAKADSEWINQFKGKSGKLSVVKTGKAGENEINAISGATITSKAVTEGVNAAVDTAKAISKAEEGENNDK